MGNSDTLAIKDFSFLLWVLRICDALFYVAAGVAVYAFYLDDFPLDQLYTAAFVFAFLLALIVFPAFGVYRSWRGVNTLEQFHKLFFAALTVALLLILISVAFKTTIHFSRVWFGLWLPAGMLTLFVYRATVFTLLKYLRRYGFNSKNIILIGNQSLNDRVVARLKEAEWSGFEVKRQFSRTDLKEFRESLMNDDIHEVWVTYSLKDANQLNDLMYEARHMPAVTFRYVPDISDFQLLLHNSVSEVAGIVTLELNHSPLDGINRVLKEIEDRVLAAIILVLISPIMLLIAIAIKLESRGPVIFKQTRHGWGRKPIKVYKFRSMVVDAEKDGFVQAKKGDARVTKVGAFIRRTSLDELPQFFNVLQGRMSIVGPRPHVIEMNQYYENLIENYFIRNKVKPGITGWAQINGWRGETDTPEKMEKRVEHDLFYIRNWSVWFDLKIIFLTIFRGFVGKNAY